MPEILTIVQVIQTLLLLSGLGCAIIVSRVQKLWAVKVIIAICALIVFAYLAEAGLKLYYGYGPWLEYILAVWWIYIYRSCKKKLDLLQNNET